MARKSKHGGLRWAKLLSALLATLLCALPLFAVLVLSPVEYIGTDMFPTIMDGDIVLIWPGQSCSPGDVIAFRVGSKTLVKRVAALGGDSVQITEEGEVMVNGSPWEPEASVPLSLGACDIEQPCVVPDGRVYVLGDERITAADSRNSSVGCIPREDILGRVFFCVWPLAAFGPVR